jgi:hypothetical protein
MKQRVVGCRDRTPQACLPRPFALTISQMQGLLQQIVGKSHFKPRLPLAEQLVRIGS